MQDTTDKHPVRFTAPPAPPSRTYHPPTHLPCPACPDPTPPTLDKGVACAQHIQLLTHMCAGHMC